MDADTRSLVRRRVSDERRRLAGAELDENGLTAIKPLGARSKALPLAAWEAFDGDALLALDYALDFLQAKREAVEAV